MAWGRLDGTIEQEDYPHLLPGAVVVTANLAKLLQHLRRLSESSPAEPSADAVLLERFVRGGEDAAFGAIVARHGPMVQAVCRRVLGDAHAAEDAFQATFLVLARKAGAIRKPHSLASWLHGVAYRIARKARTADARRRHSLQPLAVEPADPRADPLAELSARELLTILDEELQRLPEVYRLPILLCGLQCRSQEEAARQLGWTPGSLQGRLERGRARLHAQLRRRGLTLTAALLTLEASRGVDEVAAMAATVVRTVSGADVASGRVAALAEWGLRSLALAKVKMMVLVLVVCVAAGGAGVFAHRVLTGKPAEVDPPADPEPAAHATLPKPETENLGRKDVYGDPLPPGARVRMGTIRLRHARSSFAVAADGKSVISAGADQTVRIWEAATGKEIKRILLQNPPPVGDSSTTLFDLSGDGKTVVRSGDRCLQVWQAATGKPLRKIVLPDGKSAHVTLLALSHDGHGLAVVDRDANNYTLRVWDVDTGKERFHHFYKQQSFSQLEFSRDGKLLAVTGFYGFQVWDAVSSNKLLDKRANPAAVTFSPDGRTIAVSDYLGSIGLWDVMKGEEQVTLKGPGLGESTLTFSPDGKILAAGGSKGLVLWDVASRKELRRVDGEFGWLAFTADGKTLVSSAYGSINLWDVATGKALHSRPSHQADVTDFAFSPDGKTLLSLDGSQAGPRLWDAATGKHLHLLAGSEMYIHEGVFSTDGKYLVTGGGDGIVRLWDAATRKEVRKFSIEPPPQESDKPRGIAFRLSPDGRFLTALSEWGTTTSNFQVDAWEAQTGKLLVSRQSACDYFSVFSPDARTVTVQKGQTMVIQDVITGRDLVALDGELAPPAVFSPDGQILAAALEPKTRPPNTAGPPGSVPGDVEAVCLMEVATGKQLLRIRTGPFGSGLAFSRDGRLLATADRRNIHVWETATGKEILRRPSPETLGDKAAISFVTSLAFTPRGDALATGLADGTILVWELAPAAR